MSKRIQFVRRAGSRRARIAAVVLALCFAIVPRAAAAEETSEAQDPFSTPESLERFSAEVEFFKVESEIVTSVSRHPESLWGAAAAVYVLTGEDIRLSGAQSIPEALRMVPGLDVASVDRTNWAVSARGLNNTFADKMLVLLDGRPIYTPLFGGTLWAEWNTFLPDIDRIEVIRGPGGTLWGANAMNGVINIITKSATDTHGALVRGEGGSNYQFLGEARWGGHKGQFHYRLWGLGATDDGYGGDGGDKEVDSNNESRGGYRFDWDLGKGLRLIGTGEFYDGKRGTVNRDLFGNIGRFGDQWDAQLWTTMWRTEKDFADGSSARLEIAADYISQDAPFLTQHSPPPLPASLTDPFTTIQRDLYADFDHSFRIGSRHRITWGASYRLTNVDINDSLFVGLDPRQDRLNVVGGFVQDQIELWREAELTLGTKIESNTFTDTNVQPSARLSQDFGDRTTLWGAVSRAVNTPAYGDMYVTFPMAPDTTTIPGVTIIPIFTADRANDPTGTIPGIDDTELIAYELGVRHRFNDRFSLDGSAFYNDYDDIMSFSGQSQLQIVDPLDPTTITNLTFLDNSQDGKGYGIELVARLQATDWIRTELNGTWQEIDLDFGDDGRAPEWKFNSRTVIDASEQLTIVPTVHVVDQVEVGSIFGSAGGSTTIGDYLRIDLAGHYQYRPTWPTISLIGQNLTDRRHVEFEEQLLGPATPVTRSWFIRIEQEF
jgi:iron complex outermembrane receptor protein